MMRERDGAGPAWSDVAVGLGVLALAAVAGWQTTRIAHNATYAQVGPTAAPWVATVLLAGLGAVLLYQGLRGGWEHGEPHGSVDPWSLGWVLTGLVLNVTLIGNAGFIIASTVLFVCTARAFGSRNALRDAGFGLALALVAYVGFDRVLGYRIGSGLIEGLLG